MDHRNFWFCSAVRIASICAAASPPVASSAALATIRGGEAGRTEAEESEETPLATTGGVAGTPADAEAAAASFAAPGGAGVEAAALLEAGRAGAGRAVPSPRS